MNPPTPDPASTPIPARAPFLRWLASVLAVTRLTMRKTLFARRSLWVYLLAFAPLVLFTGHTLYAPRQEDRLSEIAREHKVSTRALSSIKIGAKYEDVVAKLGEPYDERTRQQRVEGGPDQSGRIVERVRIKYTDGNTDVTLRFNDGVLESIHRQNPDTLEQDTIVFATVFQLYFLRLAVFFGCVGIFTNLFRGEMLDKSLHFYLLAPMRRETLLAGKFLSGLIATVTIFTLSAVLQYAAVLARFDGSVVAEFMASEGWAHLRAYAGVTALACVAYGSIFLGAGLFFRNPIIPAAGVLIWEIANVFVPVTLKNLAMIYYLQSLCPVVAKPDTELPGPLKLLILDAPPVSAAGAVAVIAAASALIVLAACFRVRKLEINYGAD